MFHIFVEYKLQIKSVLHTRIVKNRMLQNCGIDAHKRLSRLMTRPSVCYETQYGGHLVSPETGPHLAPTDLGD